MAVVEFNCRPLALSDLYALGKEGTEIRISSEFFENVEQSRAALEGLLEKEGARYYGINTGFGSLYTTEIAKEDRIKLQENLVKSHACGTGNLLGEREVRCMLGLKILSFGWGFSGIRREVVERLLDAFLNFCRILRNLVFRDVRFYCCLRLFYYFHLRIFPCSLS